MLSLFEFLNAGITMTYRADKNIMRNNYLLIIFLLPLFLLSPDKQGWTPDIYRSICLQATKLMPASLRGIMHIHQQELLTGAQQSFSEPSRIPLLIEKNANQIISMIKEQKKFSQICQHFGHLCLLASDINNPLYINEADPEEYLYHDNFLYLTNNNLHYFVLTFDGYEHNLLEHNRLKEFLKNTQAQSEELYPYFRKFMLADGYPIEVSAFNQRSIPFALASLCYCRSVGTTANLWLYCWKRANGDLSDTPFLNKKTK